MTIFLSMTSPALFDAPKGHTAACSQAMITQMTTACQNRRIATPLYSIIYGNPQTDINGINQVLNGRCRAQVVKDYRQAMEKIVCPPPGQPLRFTTGNA
jgi:hypothetical protein